MNTIYGIKNCDTCRKALKWLKTEGIKHRFHDFRADGLEVTDVTRWISAVGWEVLLNRRSTTWRKLPEMDKYGIDDKKAIGLMLANPTLVKRPVFELGGNIVVGFKDGERQQVRDGG